jgi:signal transduction histidine kinase
VGSSAKGAGADDLDRSMIAAAHFFAARGVFGLVWIDRDLIVRRTLGDKAAFVEIGAPVSDSVIPLIGQEEFIASFQRDPSLSLELPGVAIVTSADGSQRVNLSIYFDPAQGWYFMLIARATLEATLELELVRHVRARLMAEADTTMKSKELMRANRDLEQFAAIVSHDLKAPMRALQYMADEATEALRGDPADLEAQLDLIRAQAQRMSSMLSGLLDYSTVGRRAIAVEDVDTGALARAVAASIPHGTGITVAVTGTWPVVSTLRAPLDLVIRNLVDNAVKHHDREVGTVTIDCVATDRDLDISVTDDGPGIPPEEASVIFLPFRTLTAPGRPPAGLGLGLALVQRTVESVGGRIGVVRTAPTADRLLAGAHAARGTRFEVRWPRALDTSVLLS